MKKACNKIPQHFTIHESKQGGSKNRRLSISNFHITMYFSIIMNGIDLEVVAEGIVGAKGGGESCRVGDGRVGALEGLHGAVGVAVGEVGAEGGGESGRVLEGGRGHDLGLEGAVAAEGVVGAEGGGYAGGVLHLGGGGGGHGDEDELLK